MDSFTSNTTSKLKSFSSKFIFCSQLLIISLGLPVLCYTGITHTDAKKSEHIIIRTNKGKVIEKIAHLPGATREDGTTEKA